jgi:iron(III) transport system ATP-binding protein
MIRLRGVGKCFGAMPAVEGADLEVAKGEVVGLLGPSGCGKTTLLRLIAGFERPDVGEVQLGGRVVAGSAWVPPERRHVGMVFQDYALFPHLTVAGNVGYGLPRPGRAERVRETLALAGLTDFGDRYPAELSGGQQQRVALARALAPKPSVVLLDEPWSSIDPVLRGAMRDEVTSILRATDVTVLLVTHEQEEAFSLADRVALMRAGTIVQTDDPEEIYYGPTSRWAAEFVGAANILPGRLEDGLVETPVGHFPAPNGDKPGPVEVLVRPELLELRPDPAGPGEVVCREFRGHDVFYRVRFSDGTTVCSQRPSNEAVPLGARVSLWPHGGRVAVFH